MIETEDGGMIDDISPEADAANEARLAIYSEARRIRGELVAKMIEEYANMSLEAVQRVLDKARKDIDEILAGREPHDDGPFIVEEVFKAIVELKSQQ